MDADPPDRWVNFARRNTRPRYASEAQRAPRHAFDHMLNKPAARISRAEAVNTLDGLAKAGKAAMAGRTMAYARARFRWAEQRGKVPGNPFMNLPIPAGTVERERVLSDDELGRIWNAADVMPYPWGPLFRILLLTLGRREEVAAMRWSELSSDLGSWTIPSARMKRGLPHVVALCPTARYALAAIPRIDGQDLVFSTTGRTAVSGFTKAKAADRVVSHPVV